MFLTLSRTGNTRIRNRILTQALVSGKKNIPRYYIYHKVRNRSFVKNLGHRDFRVFSTRRRQHGGMAYIIWNYDNLSTKWCIKHLPLLNLNNTTDLFPQVSYQLSSSSWSSGMFYPALNEKFKVELR